MIDLRADHEAYYGGPAPWLWCLFARVFGPMPTFWTRKQGEEARLRIEELIRQEKGNG